MNILSTMHWGFDISIIEFFNQWTNSKFFEILFKGITNLGTETVFIVLIGLTYWAIDKRIGKEVGQASFYGMFMNGVFKSVFNRLRPFQQSPSTITCRDESILLEDVNGNHILSSDGYYLSSSTSFPSGHSTNSAAVYNSFYLSTKNKIVLLVGNIICLLVMISRMALGVHFLTDVLSGYVLGFGVVYLVYFLRTKFKNENVFHIILLSVFGVITFLSPLWSGSTRDLFIAYGLCVSLFISTIFENKKVNFKHTKSIWKNVLRVVIGLALAFGIKTGLKLIYSSFLEEGTYLANVCDMLRYGIMMFLLCAIYPMSFKLKFLGD